MNISKDQQGSMLREAGREPFEVVVQSLSFQLLEGSVFFRRLIVHFIEGLMMITMSTMMTIVQMIQ